QETRLSTLRPVTEFFDYNRISRPADLNTATQVCLHAVRYFSGNYLLVVIALSVYALITNRYLIFALVFLVGGFIAINKWAPEPMQVGEHVVTQKSLYTVLFVVGIPLVWWAEPFGTLFWVIGSSLILILGHAALVEPGVESEYSELEAGQV
ncbi:prenylated rab acceptor PRA1, partial [Exidia glandulosa HHB12029]